MKSQVLTSFKSFFFFSLFFLIFVNNLFSASSSDNPLYFNDSSRGNSVSYQVCEPDDNPACKKSSPQSPAFISFGKQNRGSIWPDGLLGTASTTFDDEAKVSKISWSLDNDQITVIFTEAGRLSGHKNGDILSGKIISDKVIQIDGAYYFAN